MTGIKWLHQAGIPVTKPMMARVVCEHKIKKVWPKDCHSMLMYSVVERAILDASGDIYKAQDSVTKSYNEAKESARDYLNNDLIHAEICGIDPEWIRRVLTKCGLEF